MSELFIKTLAVIGVLGVIGLLFLWFFSTPGLGQGEVREAQQEEIQKTFEGREGEGNKEEKEITLTEMSRPTSASLVFGGDVMLDRYIRTIAERNEYETLLEGNTDILPESDAVVINLEGPITENPSRSMGSAIGSRENYYFTFAPESVNFLLSHNMTIAHLGNNHIYNFGAEGLASTQKYLEDAEIAYFGALKDLPKRNALRQTINGIDISLISHNEFSEIRSERILELIREERDWADFVVLYAHWGVEYKTTPTQAQRQIAHSYIDSGADIVIGSHPHVVQEIEEYKGKKIYYSLGNFIFDQYFSEEVRNGLLLEITFTSEGKLHTEEIPVTLSPSGKTHIGNIQ